jgi:hypothetical protein
MRNLTGALFEMLVAFGLGNAVIMLAAHFLSSSVRVFDGLEESTPSYVIVGVIAIICSRWLLSRGREEGFLSGPFLSQRQVTLVPIFTLLVAALCADLRTRSDYWVENATRGASTEIGVAVLVRADVWSLCLVITILYFAISTITLGVKVINRFRQPR